MRFRLVAFGELALYDVESHKRVTAPRKALALMAVLAANRGKPASRDRLIALLWPENTNSGRQALKQTIYELRQVLGDASVVTGTAELSLDTTAVGSDVAELESAQAASDWARVEALYAGPFLDGFHVRDSVEFDHWVDANRARYDAVCGQALEQLAGAASARGDHAAAVTLWRRRVAQDQLSARPAIGLLEALAASGDTAAALAYFQTYQRLLQQELGLPPEPAVVAVAERIRARGGAGTREETITTAAPSPQSINAAPPSLPAEGAPAPVVPPAPPSERPRTVTPRVWIAVAVATLVVAAVLIGSAMHNRQARVLQSLALPLRAYRVSVDPHIGRVYVDGGANFDATLAVFEGAMDSARTLPHGAGTAIDPVTQWYWSGDYGGRQVIVRNGRTDAEIGRVPVPGCPHSFAIAGERVWVAQQCDDHISVIDSRQRRVIRHIPIATLSRAEVGGAKGVGEIVVNRNTGVAYFTKDGMPHRVDPERWEVRETHGFDGAVIAINEATNRLYVKVEGGLRVLDGTSEKLIGQVLLPGTPNRAAVGFGGRRVYITVNSGLVALDGETQRVLFHLPLGDSFVADAMSLDPARNLAYVAGSEPSGRRALKVVALAK